MTSSHIVSWSWKFQVHTVAHGNCRNKGKDRLYNGVRKVLTLSLILTSAPDLIKSEAISVLHSKAA